MRLKSIITKAVIVIGLGALIWLGLGKFNNVADDNCSTAFDNRNSHHEVVDK